MTGYMQGTPGASVVADWSGITAISNASNPKIAIGYQANGAHETIPNINADKGGVIQVTIKKTEGDGSKHDIEIQFISTT